jgi:hypothetical protein
MSTNLSSSQYPPLKDLISDLVEKHFPDEVDVFELKGDKWIDNALEDIKDGHKGSSQSKFGAADPFSVLGVINTSVVVFGAVKTFLEILKLYREQKQSPDKDSLVTEFVKTLKKNGMESSKATEIANDFVSQALTRTKS